jgi:hypothetical protein
MAIKRNRLGFYIICLVVFIGTPVLSLADDGNILVLDCTKSGAPTDLTSQLPTVYLPRKNFDSSKFSGNGEIFKSDFSDLTRAGLKIPKVAIRFKIRKNDEVTVYIVTSMRMDTFEQSTATEIAPLQWVTDPVNFVTSNFSRDSGPVTTMSQPITLSIVKTARFLLKEQQRPTSLESGRDAKASAVFGVTFEATRPPLGPEEKRPSGNVYYYYRQKYKLKFDNATVSLSFQDQNGNLEDVATIITGPSDNWFLTAGGPIFAYNSGTDFGDNPTGLYVGLNWTPNDIFDPFARFLIVNFLDVNTTNPTSAIGLVGLGMGFPKTSHFIPLSTLSVTEVLAYNLTLSKFQFLTMINYDVTDILQLLKL